VILWDAKTGKAERRLEVDSAEVRSLGFSEDGSRLAGGSRGGVIFVWDVPAGALLRTMTHTHMNFVACVQFSPSNGRCLATQSGDEIWVWDVDSGDIKMRREGCMFAAWSPDGTLNPKP